MNQSPTTDWRGRPIEVGTKVIYHRNHNGIATWGIGKVTGFRSNTYEEPLIDIEWEQHTGDFRVARGVSVNHVTVWPIQSAGRLKTQLTDFVDSQVIY